MLQKLNERIQGVVAWLVIILIAITFTLFGVDYYLQSHQTSNAKVVVNDQPLSNQQFETNFRRQRAQQDITKMSAADEKKLQDQVVSQMVANEVTVQAAHHYGFEVSPDQANAAILTIPQFQEDGHFSAQRYQQALSNALFTPATFQNEVRQGMLLNQQRFAFIGSSFALPDEIKRFVKLYMQTRDYDYLIIPASRFELQAKISLDEITNYYNNHLNEFMDPEQVSLEYVSLSMQDIKTKIKVSQEDIARHYEENKNSYLTPAQWQVAHILFAVPENASVAELEQIKKKADAVDADLKKNPEQFNQLVKTLSDDKLSIAEKGVLPWITAGQNEYDKVLSQLIKPGQISAPERFKHGFEIFRLIAYRPASIKPLAEVESTIRAQLITEIAQTQYAQSLEQLSDLSYQTPDSLKPVADSLKLPIQKTGFISRAGNASGLTGNKQVINSAFSHDVLELANNSEPIQLDNDSVIVLRVKEHIPVTKQKFSIAQEQIRKTLTRKFAIEKAKEVASILLNPANKNQQDLMDANQLKWVSVNKASRDNEKPDSLINDAAFNLLRVESREGVVLQNGDYVVVKLNHIEDGKLSVIDKEQRDSLVQQIEASYGMMDYDIYINNLISHAKVVRN